MTRSTPGHWRVIAVYFSPPIYAFGSLWVSSLETNEVLRIRVGD
jgi:hypothetical protein